MDGFIKFYPFRRLLISLILLSALLVIGISGYRHIEGFSFFDALYMTIITISTVGFGEIRPLSEQGRVFTIGLIIGGVVFAGYTLNVLAEYLFSGEWLQHCQQQKINHMLTKLSNHTIVCGYGR